MSTTGNHSTAIPFLDLISPHRELEAELLTVFESALSTASFIGGPMVEDFERSFGDFCAAAHCVGVGSGTDALRFALIAAGVRAGDTVLTTPNTFIATTEAISQAGAASEFVDIEERTYNMDPEKLREFLETQCYIDQAAGFCKSRKTGRRVRAVVLVHLYGQMAEMDTILEIAETHGLIVVEDACQAHGAEYFSRKEGRWRKAGSMGRAAAFSFYPGKNLGACGEAGAVTTSDRDLAQTVRMLRDHGQSQKYYHSMEGYNGRLDAIQAGILRVKLKHLEGWNDLRRSKALLYRELLASRSEEIVLPYESLKSKAVYHLYVIRTKTRDSMRADLAEAHIGTGIHYPIPLHLQEAYRGFGYQAGDFPITEMVATEILSLPMYPQLTSDQQTRIADRLTDFVDKAASNGRLLASR
jgi:dTDP-4-amino-4,6-dideoxygalactose transaminase